MSPWLYNIVNAFSIIVLIDFHFNANSNNIRSNSNNSRYRRERRDKIRKSCSWHTFVRIHLDWGPVRLIQQTRSNTISTKVAMKAQSRNKNQLCVTAQIGKRLQFPLKQHENWKLETINYKLQFRIWKWLWCFCTSLRVISDVIWPIYILKSWGNPRNLIQKLNHGRFCMHKSNILRWP